MKLYCEQFISEDEKRLFFQIRSAVQAMVDPELGLDKSGEKVVLSCHMIARAVAKIFPVTLEDGYFAKSYEHSWVRTKDGHLIDAYPIGVIGGPIMLENANRFSPARRLYEHVPTRTFSRGLFGKPSFQRSVRRVAKALHKVIKTTQTNS